jgi:hypothetical protein
MRNLLATTAIAVMAMAGTASAQSVLQRILTSIDDIPNASTVNGTFANIAENIGVLQTEQIAVYAFLDGDGPSSTLTQSELDAIIALEVRAAIASIVADPDGTDTVYRFGEQTFDTLEEAEAEARRAATDSILEDVVIVGFVEGATALLNQIDGSITNTLEGITAATASNGSVFAINEVTVDIGDLTTTVLGAVNTGDIALGANMGVSEAVAGASQAIHGTIDQIGGSVDTAALVLNIASNSTSVLGNVNNQFASLNGSIGNVTTTVLGSVNTGTITNGLNASINGTISDIVGATND